MGRERKRAASYRIAWRSGDRARPEARLARGPVYRCIVGLLGSSHYVVMGDSMRPGFKPGQRLMVSRTGYSFSLPKRGDVVIVRGLGGSRKAHLKRVVGLPGETVAFVESTLLVDGDQILEPYLGGLPSSVGLEERSWRLGVRDIFVLGDNRSHSTDSRELGAVDVGHIVGRVIFRYWPLREFGGVR